MSGLHPAENKALWTGEFDSNVTPDEIAKASPKVRSQEGIKVEIEAVALQILSGNHKSTEQAIQQAAEVNQILDILTEAGRQGHFKKHIGHWAQEPISRCIKSMILARNAPFYEDKILKRTPHHEALLADIKYLSAHHITGEGFDKYICISLQSHNDLAVLVEKEKKRLNTFHATLLRRAGTTQGQEDLENDPRIAIIAKTYPDLGIGAFARSIRSLSCQPSPSLNNFTLRGYNKTVDPI